MPKPEDKYRDLERKALATLRRPFDAPGFVSLLRPALRLIVWRYPAFEPFQSWSLIEELSVGDVSVLRRVTWDRAEDYGRAGDPQRQAGLLIEQAPSPTLDVIDLRVSGTFVARTVAAVEALERPSAQGRAGIALDGVMNGFAIDERGVELEWWCEGPPDWHRFTKSMEAVRSGLEATIAG